MKKIYLLVLLCLGFISLNIVSVSATDQIETPAVDEVATDQIETPVIDEVVADQIETPVVDEVATDQIETPVIDEVVINNKSLEYSLLRSYDMNVYTYKKIYVYTGSYPSKSRYYNDGVSAGFLMLTNTTKLSSGGYKGTYEGYIARL